MRLHVVLALVAVWQGVAIGIAPPPPNPCRADLQVRPWCAHLVTATVPPETAQELCGSTKMFPGLRPECLILADGQPVARVPLTADARLQFYLAANVIRDRTALSVELYPSATRTLHGDATPWALTVTRCEPVPYVRQTYTIDVGHSADVPFVGSGFSYQEGAQARDPAWAFDTDYRWSRPGCRLRVPVVPGNTHTLTLAGGVPVGFRVLCGGQELAPFARSETGGPYTFEVAAEVTARESFLDLTLINIDPMPLPNLDLRELFWALEKIELATYGPGGFFEPATLPAADLADAAFRAAWSMSDPAASAVPIALKARWELPAGYKTAAQLEQEVATVLAHGAGWTPADDADPADAAYVAAQLLAPACRLTAELKDVRRGGRPVGDIGILVARDQRLAARLRPSTSDPLLEPARGAFRLLERMQRTTIIIDETQLPQDPRALPCLVVPNPTFCPQAIWPRLQNYVEQGGKLITVANLSLPFEREPAAGTLVGARPKSYERGWLRIPCGDIEIPIYNNDWQAVLTLGSARELLPGLPTAGRGGEAPPWPAVCLRELGSGRVATLAYDVFRDYNRYSDPLYAVLLGYVLEQLDVVQTLHIHGAPAIVPTVQTTAEGPTIVLTNVARGHYDSGGLMNASCRAIFADAIPASPPVKLTFASPARVADVRFVPPDPAAVWKWSDGTLDITTSPVAIQQAIVVRTDASPAARVLSLPAGLPADVPLVSIAESVRADLGLVPPLQTPWPVEKLEGRPLLWLGTGPAEGLTFNVVCAHPRKLLLRIEAASGHGRTDFLRHLVLTRDGEPAWSGTLDKAAILEVPVELGPGEHDLCLHCTDEATVLKHPNGDTRHLLVALRGVRLGATP